jgi:hypothetical protein
MSDRTDARRTPWVVAAVVGVVLLAAVVTWAVTRHHDDDTGHDQGADSGSTSSVPSSTPTHPSDVPSTSLGTSLTPGSGATEPTHTVRTKRPVPLDATADFGTGLTVRITKITPVTGKATAPGEVDGPALRLDLLARNTGKRTISLDGSVVFVSYGPDRTPATELSSGEQRFSGSVAPGATQRATYVFTVPKDQRDDVRVEVSYTGRAPTVALQGPA